ncbi:TrmH family RNA methyltransferase [Demequina capsici]|uniref:RNA methyltransferase n=1 Tax=Demequina capsici TaxID=3075620 RepID=A0AA96F3I9_9MICO|nr:RNA methyltransferase [Demequina sp. OYTSA14]WNM23313.1 RNA methyltransferase [Demequina sp. OYTSA14]
MTGLPAGPRLRDMLSNPRADRVKGVRALAGRSARDRSGTFLVEGPQAVREAVRFASDDVRDVYVTDAARLAHPEIVDEGLEAGLYVHPVTDEVAQAMSADAQGVLAVLNAHAEPGLDALPSAPRLVAVLSAVRDPGNLGAAIRVADAVGADAVVLAGDCVDPRSPKVIRASVGSVFHLPVLRAPRLTESAALLRERGLALVGADVSGTVLLGRDTERILATSHAWIMGNEAWGLTSDELRELDHVVRIPIVGQAESLNLATAAAVCLYASLFARS